jgi:hypothetical protein
MRQERGKDIPYLLSSSLVVESDYGKIILYLKASDITLVCAHLLEKKCPPHQ